MEIVRQHFRTHGVVHLSWLIIMLILASVALITYRPDAEQVNSFINFAATLASLFLAVIAIFYSIVSNSDLSNLLGKSAEGADSIMRVAERVDAVSDRLERQSDELSASLSEVPTAIEALRSDVQQRLDAFAQPERAAGTDAPGKLKLAGPVASVIGLYTVSKSYLSEKEVDLTSLTGNQPRYIKGILLGFLSCIKLFKPCGIEIEYAAGNFRVTNPGSLDTNMWANYNFEKEPEAIRDAKEIINNMLGLNDDEQSDSGKVDDGDDSSNSDEP